MLTKEDYIKIVYASRTGNVESIVNKLKIQDPLRISSGQETTDQDYILFTYTDGYGDIPTEVDDFIGQNANHIKGVIVSGDLGYGEAYYQAGDEISAQYDVPCLYKIENDGTEEDIETISRIIAKL